ncbi:MAG: TrkA family potassium uptake protein [Actinobacteria bacterium]|nr:TrkA family potassium uptake protein [Actinomycetota bacterium]
MKQFAVIGLGRFGSAVATTLAQMGHEVLGVDNDEANIQALSHHLTHVVQADCRDEEVLKSLGVRNFDVVVVAIGNDLEGSILVTVLLKEIGVKYVIAKARNELHGKVLYKVGADRVVFPERDMGARVAHNLVSSNILDYIELSPEYGVVELTASKFFAGKTLKQLDLRNRYGANVMAIKKGETITVAPKADDVINEGDVLVVIGDTESLSRLEIL